MILTTYFIGIAFLLGFLIGCAVMNEIWIKKSEKREESIRQEYEDKDYEEYPG